VAISGTLTLGVSSGNLPVDPAVQFSTGGRTVAFTIPANTTKALFGNQGNQGSQIGIQTGTVGSNMNLSATFATQAGNVALTPANPVVLDFAVNTSAPTLVSGQVTSAANSITLRVTGYSTNRSLTNLRVQFEPVAGVNISTTQFTIDVSQAAAVWFRSTASQTFGGQFAISVPFNFSGSLPDGSAVTNAIASLSVSAGNEIGSSNTLQVRRD
jgi:hypothetical protein